MDEYRKTQSEITRIEWIRWVWVDVTAISDKERTYIRGIERPIKEMMEAGEQWDYYNSIVRKDTRFEIVANKDLMPSQEQLDAGGGGIEKFFTDEFFENVHKGFAKE